MIKLLMRKTALPSPPPLAWGEAGKVSPPQSGPFPPRRRHIVSRGEIRLIATILFTARKAAAIQKENAPEK